MSSIDNINHFAEHHNRIAFENADTTQTITVFERVQHKRLLRLERNLFMFNIIILFQEL